MCSAATGIPRCRGRGGHPRVGPRELPWEYTEGGADDPRNSKGAVRCDTLFSPGERQSRSSSRGRNPEALLESRVVRRGLPFLVRGWGPRRACNATEAQTTHFSPMRYRNRPQGGNIRSGAAPHDAPHTSGNYNRQQMGLAAPPRDASGAKRKEHAPSRLGPSGETDAQAPSNTLGQGMAYVDEDKARIAATVGNYPHRWHELNAGRRTSRSWCGWSRGPRVPPLGASRRPPSRRSRRQTQGRGAPQEGVDGGGAPRRPMLGIPRQDRQCGRGPQQPHVSRGGRRPLQSTTGVIP